MRTFGAPQQESPSWPLSVERGDSKSELSARGLAEKYDNDGTWSKCSISMSPKAAGASAGAAAAASATRGATAGAATSVKKRWSKIQACDMLASGPDGDGGTLAIYLGHAKCRERNSPWMLSGSSCESCWPAMRVYQSFTHLKTTLLPHPPPYPCNPTSTPRLVPQEDAPSAQQLAQPTEDMPSARQDQHIPQHPCNLLPPEWVHGACRWLGGWPSDSKSDSGSDCSSGSFSSL